MTKGVGTPQYMAPEMLVGTQSYKYAKALDVYSFSILLLEIWEVRDVFGESGMSHFEICQFVIDGNVKNVLICFDLFCLMGLFYYRDWKYLKMWTVKFQSL